MNGESLLVWMVVGLISGWLASAVVGGGLGLIREMIAGMVGAIIGAFLFRALDIQVPFEGMAGNVTVAFVGAVVLLVVLRMLRRSRWA